MRQIFLGVNHKGDGEEPLLPRGLFPQPKNFKCLVQKNVKFCTDKQASRLSLDGGCGQPGQGFPEPVVAMLPGRSAQGLEKTVCSEIAPRAEGLRPGEVQSLLPHV